MNDIIESADRLAALLDERKYPFYYIFFRGIRKYMG